jgi:hypothetical protein
MGMNVDRHAGSSSFIPAKVGIHGQGIGPDFGADEQALVFPAASA